MGVSCVLRFKRHKKVGGAIVARVYLHGVPDDVKAHMGEFFAAVESQCPYPGDSRFHDPGYLAAKFVMWTAAKNVSEGGGGPLDFYGVGITAADKGDCTYDVECIERILAKGRPRVKEVR